MGKTILLIESDAAFAREMSAALEARGFAVRTTGDGKEGLDVARDLRPDAIVLCVELPRMSGYSVCNKLKKDDALRAIPLVIISAEATPETFEQHRKLKTRAEDYLIKPFAPQALVERIGALVGLPAASEEEVVTLADVELEQVVQDVPPLRLGGEEDDDLKLLDDAFDSIARVDAPAPEAPAATLPELEAEPAPASPAEAEAAAPAEPLEPAEPLLLAEPEFAEGVLVPAGEEAPGGDVQAASAEQLRAAGIPLLEPEPPAPAVPEVELQPVAPLAGLEDAGAELRALREEVSRARAAAEEATRAAGTRESELLGARARLEAVQGSVKRLEADLKASREEARRAQDRASGLEKELAAIRARLDELEQVASRSAAEVADAQGRAESLERALEEARTEVSVTRSEAEALRGEADRRTADLRRRVQELESQNARHEERVVKAYQKIKSDEKLKEKTRKALAIALQLLDERLPVEGGDPPAGPERPASQS
ncbi:MAG TPA: response regulator [Anaeromyxobacteraceae bacterium]|nr:response regulator [Anaeromyxobacteraceae bacterium]